MNREIVGAAQQIVEGDRLDVHLSHHAWIGVWVVRDHRHAQHLAAHGHGARDVAEREQAQGEPAQPGPRVGGGADVFARERQALVDLRVGEAKPAVAGEQEHQGVVGHFFDAEVGNVANGDPVPRRGF